MPVSSLSIIRVGSMCLSILLAASAWAQSGSGNMMKVDITMKMQLPGAANMPAQKVTQNVCMSSDPDMRAMLQQQKDCAVSDYRKVGNVVSYHVVRSEEHTSELQSLMRISYAVFCLKKIKVYTNS